VIDYARTFAWEFRYDSPRARYLRRELDPDSLPLEGGEGEPEVISDEWSHYDGDEYYSDFAWSAGDAPGWVPVRSYLAGVGHADVDSSSWTDKTYYHGDPIGSTRALSESVVVPQITRTYVYTAFGELVSTSGTTDTRYRYAGAWGYESHVDFPFLHVGARWYDPETGRFLQHDPIGIRGGLNVYAYMSNIPTAGVDPDGELFWVPVIVVAAIIVAVIEDVAEAPGPSDTEAEMAARRRANERENIVEGVSIACGSFLWGLIRVPMPRVEVIVKTRPTLGADGGVSRIIITKVDGVTYTVEHVVTKGWRVIHAHYKYIAW